MNNNVFIISDIKEYIVFISQVKNLSENTSKSYERDLKKLHLFLSDSSIFNVKSFDLLKRSSFIDAVFINEVNKSIKLLCSSLNFVTCRSRIDEAELDECLNFNSLTKDSLDSKKSKFSNKNISTSLGSSFLLINISFI